MKTTRLGRTGLEVSRMCLGCMSFGVPERGNHLWTLSEADSLPFFRRAVELGCNFFDTANVYSDGTSEEITGRALRELGSRDDWVIATKLHGRMHPGLNGAGLSRKAIFREVDASLQRLGTDYIDLYQIHRYDPHTPLLETLAALHDLVKSGKVRYLGASSMFAWQFCQALYEARLHRLTPFVSMQNHYNLLYREEEREMLGLCRDQGVAVLPWSPLARGRLTRPAQQASTRRSDTDEFGRTLYFQNEASDAVVVARVEEVARGRGLPMAQIAMAWVASRPGVTAPIVGATKLAHLDDAAAGLDLELSSEEVARLEEPYQPHPVRGFA